MPYTEDEMLMLSGIQHYAFCPRQWALIHIEQAWDENVLTTEGKILHQHVDDPFYRQKVGDAICLRSVSLASTSLGLYGVSDVVELHPTHNLEDSVTHPEYPGRWQLYPVEYKHGKPKSDDADVVQLAAQAMCLEEQYQVHIGSGAIFYGEIRRRQEIVFTEEHHSLVREYAEEMHAVFHRGAVPQAEMRPRCKSCSLMGVCMPQTAKKHCASDYLKRTLYAETT